MKTMMSEILCQKYFKSLQKYFKKHLNADKLQRVLALQFVRPKNFLKTSAEYFPEPMSYFKTFFISKILKQIIIREKTGNLPVLTLSHISILYLTLT